jgi:tRNA dimethylallyltransferase
MPGKNGMVLRWINSVMASDLRTNQSPRHAGTVIILLGPTGIGKTELSVRLAKALDTEIISADSMQIYRHMNIGTSTPSLKTLGEVKHHLVNILSPNEFFSAGMFKKMAIKIIHDLHKKNRIPLIVGGTGLYIRTLTRGLFEGPGADWSLRDVLKQKEQDCGKGYLYQYLQKTDSEAAERINPNDIRRVVRALEVSLKGKRAISMLQKKSTKPQNFHFVKIGLSRNRKELYSLIGKRVDAMIESGLAQEAEKLFTMNPHRIPLQALGYKEMRLYLDGLMTLENAVKLLKKRTKMYAKRQITWFKKEPGVQWVDISGVQDADEIYLKVLDNIEMLSELPGAKKITGKLSP